MNAGELLHLIFLGPLEFLFRAVLSASYALTGHYGWSIILLSLFITAVTTPLYYLAELWKAEEGTLQARMASDIAGIKKHYAGQKRFYLIRTTHRLFGYRWWFSLRTSFGLLIQIPFFFGAYNVLSHYDAFRGQSFLFLQDLSRPDGLLGGVNVMPFVMTAINVAYSFYYTRAKTLKANAQLLAMAGLFLLLLYGSPSALLVYWTMNNVFSFIKGILFRIFGLEHHAPVVEQEDGSPTLRELLSANRSLVLFCAFAAVWAFQVWFLSRFGKPFRFMIAGMLFGAVLASAAAVVRSGLRRLPAIAALWVPIFVFLFLFEKRSDFSRIYSGDTVKLLLVFFADFAIVFCVRMLNFKPSAADHVSQKFSVPAAADRSADVRNGIILFSAIAADLFLLTPLALFLGNPAEIGASLAEVLLASSVLTALSLLVFVTAFLAGPKRFRPAVLAFLCGFSLIALAYPAAFTVDTGLLDGYKFHKEFAVKLMPAAQFAFDWLVVCACASCGVWIVRNRSSWLPALAAAVFLVPLAALVLSSDEWTGTGTEDAASSYEQMIHDARKNHRFSRDGTNAVIVVADMFNGNYLGRMLEEDPSLARRLEGFSWYPDTLSPSSATATSFAALLGGRRFEPAKLNNDGKTGQQSIDEAAALLFGAFAEKGYSGLLGNPSYFEAPPGSSLTTDDGSSYVRYWRDKNGYPASAATDEKVPLLFMLSLFHSTPWSCRFLLYDDGRWMVFSEENQIASVQRNAIQQMAHTDLLPELCAADASGNRLFYLYTLLTHVPYGIGNDGMPIRESYPDPSEETFFGPKGAYLSARKEILMLADWFDWMRANGVWDNTAILVMSDHGNSYNDNGIALPESIGFSGAHEEISRAASLLMFKGLGSGGELAVSSRLMAGSDGPALLAGELGLSSALAEELVPGAVSSGDSARTRRYSVIQSHWEDNLGKDTVPYRTYDVSGPMLDPSSWRISGE